MTAEMALSKLNLLFKRIEPPLPRLLVVLFTILLSGSLFYASTFKNALLIPFLSMLLLYCFHQPCDLSKKKILYLLCCIALIVLNSQFITSSVLVLSTCLLCAFLITEMISFDSFSLLFIRIVLFLCVTSWFFLPVILLDIPSPLPDFISIVGTPYSNFVFFGIYHEFFPSLAITFPDKLYFVTRNSGIFWEPGAFQIFVNIAFYLGMISNQLSLKRILIFEITILTIQSTSGLVVFALLATAYFIHTRKNNSRAVNLRFLVVPVLYVGFFLLPGSYNTQIEKFQKGSTGQIEKFQKGSSSYVSYLSRSSDFKIDANIVADHFLRGVGYGNYEIRKQYGIDLMGKDIYTSVATPTGADGIFVFLGQVGIFGLILLWRLIYPSQIRMWKFLPQGLIVASFLIIYNSENMFMYLLPWVMVFYGFKSHSEQVLAAAPHLTQIQ